MDTLGMGLDRNMVGCGGGCKAWGGVFDIDKNIVGQGLGYMFHTYPSRRIFYEHGLYGMEVC